MSSCCSFLFAPVVAVNDYFSQNLPLHLQSHSDEFTGMFLIIATVLVGAFISYINRVLFTHIEEHTTTTTTTATTTPNHHTHHLADDHIEQSSPILIRKEDNIPHENNNVHNNAIANHNSYQESQTSSETKSPEKSNNTPTRRGRSPGRPRRSALEPELISDIIGSRTSTRSIKPPSRFSPGGGVAFEITRSRRSPTRRNSLSRDEI